MPTETHYAIHIFTRRAIEAQQRRAYEVPPRYELQELPHTPLLGRLRRAVRRTR